MIKKPFLPPHKTIQRLSEAGIPVCVMLAPVVLGLTDHEIEQILDAAHDAGAIAANWIALRLPREVSSLFSEWLENCFPDRSQRVLRCVRDMHGARDYDPDWNKRMQGQGVWSALIADRFKLAVARIGFRASLPPLRIDLFSPTKASGQLSLF